MTESTEPAPAERPSPPAAAWKRTRLPSFLRWTRVRAALVALVLAVLVTRVAIGLLLDYALDKATRGTLGLACKVGHSELHLFHGSAILGDVSLVSSTGAPVAVLGRAELDLSWTALPNLIVDRLSIEDVELTLKRDARGEIPALASILGGKKTEAPVQAPKPAKGAAPKGDAALPVVLLEKMRIHHIRLHWEDEFVQPHFRGELVLDARADEIATFGRPQPPSFSLRLISPGILDNFRFDVAGRTLEDDVRGFDIVLSAEAHPQAIAPYLGKSVQVCTRTVSLAVEGRANARPTYLDGGRYFTGDFTLERVSVRADDDEIDLGRIVAVFPRLSRQRVEISSLAIDHPRIRFGRLVDGTLRFLGFGLKGGKAASQASDAPAAPASEPLELPAVNVKEIAVHDGRLSFGDESTRPATSIEAVGEGRIQDIVFDPASAGQTARIAATCALPGIIEQIGVSGALVPVGAERELTLDLTADRIGFARLAPYLARAGLEPDLRDGTAQAQVRARTAAAGDGSLSFSAEIKDARYLDARHEEATELLGVKSVRLEDGHLGTDGVRIGKVVIEDPRIAARRLRNGAISVAGVRTALTPPPAPLEASSDVEPEAPVPASGGGTAIDDIVLSGGKIAWRDDALEQPSSFALEGGALEVTGLALGGSVPRPAAMRASAKLLPAIGELSLEAWIVPDPRAPYLLGNLAAKELSLRPLVGYMKASSIEPTLERGRFETGVALSAHMRGAAIVDSRIQLAPVSLKSGVDELAGIDSIELTGTKVDPATRTTEIGDLTISGVRGRAYRDAQGAIRCLGIKINPRPPTADAAPVASAAPATATRPPAPADRADGGMRMGKVAIKDVSFSWRDDQVTPGAFVRLERLEATLGPHRLGKDERPGEPPVPFTVHAEVDRVATLDVDGGIVFATRTPGLTAKVRVSDLTLAALAPYLASSGCAPVLDRGELDLAIEARSTLDPGITGAKVEVSGLALTDGGHELLGLDRIQLPVELDDITRTLHVGEVVLERPRVRASRTKDGSTLSCGLLFAPGKSADAPSAPVKPPPQPKAEKPLDTIVDGLRVDGLEASWQDDVLGSASVEVKKASVEMGPLRPGKRTITPWKVRADLSNLGDLELEGTAILSTRTSVEADLRLSRMNGRDISPYLGEGTTLDLTDGKLAAKLAYASEPNPRGGQKIDVAVDKLALEEEGRVLLAWDALRAAVGRSDAAKKVYIVDDLELSNLRGEISKERWGKTRMFGFDRTPAPPAPPAKDSGKQPGSSDPPPLPSVVLRKLAISASKIAVRDLTRPDMGEPLPYVLTNVQLKNVVPFILAKDDPTTAILDLTLTGEGSPVFESASATIRAIPFDAEPQARLEVDLKGLYGAPIIERSPLLAGKYDLSALKGGFAHLGGSFAVKSHERIDQLARHIAFELDIDSFEVRSSPEGPVLLGLDELRVDVADYDTKTGGAHIHRVELLNPVARLAKEKEGFRALDVLFKKPPPPPEGSTPPPATEPPKETQPQKPDPASSIRIDKITIEDGDVAYLDSSVSPIANLQSGSFEVQILGFTTDFMTQKRPMEIGIRLRQGTYEDFKIKGRLSMAPKLDGDLEQVRILSLPLEKISGYTEQMYKLVFKGGKLDIEAKVSARQGHVVADCRITFMRAEIEEPPDGCPGLDQGQLVSIKKALSILADDEDQVQVEVAIPLEVDAHLHVVGSGWPDIGKLIRDALFSSLKGLVGDVTSVLGKERTEPPKADPQPPIPFDPVETEFPPSATRELEKIVDELKANPLYYVSLRGEIGQNDKRRTRTLASPSPADRHDLIARLETERATQERVRADAVAEVRASLQAGTDDVGTGRSHLTEAQAKLAKIDRSLEDLYEQEREGAERQVDRHVRSLERKLCDDRVEAIRAWLIQHGAPAERVKTEPPRLKPVQPDAGKVSFTTWIAHRKGIERSAVEQKPEDKKPK